MSISNVEKINTYFKLPIFYNEKKEELNKNIVTDLELIKTIDPSACSPLYHYAFQPKTIFAEKLIDQMANYYTTDTKFLKDTQKLLSTFSTFEKSGAKPMESTFEKSGAKPMESTFEKSGAKPVDEENSLREKFCTTFSTFEKSGAKPVGEEKSLEEKFCTTFSKSGKSGKSGIMEIWDEIKNDTGFKERYHYIDWPMWEHLNKSDYFLQLMSVYNLAAPVISLCVPLIILIIPFFIIKIKGLTLSIAEYIEILKTIAENHALGKLFTKFHSVKIEEKIYILLSAAFYVFSIYQNILTCTRFHQNMKKIHSHLDEIKKYIQETEARMYNFLLYSSPLSSYEKFNTNLKGKLSVLTDLRKILEKISPYMLSYSKIGEFGYTLKQFYDIYTDEKYNDAFLYSFGFNGYLDNLEGLIENIKNGHISLAKFTTKKNSNSFKNAYYPALIYNNPIKNSFKFNKNIIITGPNASGKTTTLKTALVNVIITQQFGCGFYKSANLNPYNYIHCYLNIPDTSGRDSLFQAEARRCKEIIDVIQETTNKENHFCVFDELYSGTNPDEAVLSAHAFMQYLIKYKNVNCILTTHFIDLCKKLEKNQAIENFHMKTIKSGDDFNYTYILEKGISTVRGGIKVLHDMNYPKEIIENSFSHK